MAKIKNKKRSKKGKTVNTTKKRGRPELTPGETAIRQHFALSVTMDEILRGEAKKQGYKVSALIRYFVEYCLKFGIKAPRKDPDDDE